MQGKGKGGPAAFQGYNKVPDTGVVKQQRCVPSQHWNGDNDAGHGLSMLGREFFLALSFLLEVTGNAGITRLTDALL